MNFQLLYQLYINSYWWQSQGHKQPSYIVIFANMIPWSSYGFKHDSHIIILIIILIILSPNLHQQACLILQCWEPLYYSARFCIIHLTCAIEYKSKVWSSCHFVLFRTLICTTESIYQSLSKFLSLLSSTWITS